MKSQNQNKAAYKLLLNSGQVPKEQLDQAWKEAEASNLSFTQALVKLPNIKEAEVLDLYAKATGTPRVALKELPFDKAIMAKVPIKVAWYYKFFPYKLDNDKLSIAVSQLLDISTLDEIRFGIGLEIQPALAPEKDIEDMLKKHYGLAADTVNKILIKKGEEANTGPMPASLHEVEDIEHLGDGASIAQLVNQIILDAYKKRASDIHLEPFRNKIRLRYRIDGVLHEAPVPVEMRKFFMSIISRIKIMANLNVIEKRMPQDGKMRVKTQDQTLDLRVSCIPTSHGESMGIRILPTKNIYKLDDLGFEPEQLKKIYELIAHPNGVIFVTGPTGSGKSTTLYAALNALNNEERKMITIEDPVEYELEGISQMQINTEIGLTFAQGLRSLLRHDTDVMMVGEVRDFETADTAIRAALTGHLMFSTLHTNDAASGITRLIDIGVEPYLVASSVTAFIAQRLVRLVCPHCKIEETINDETKALIVEDLQVPASSLTKFSRGKGCDTCNKTGYLGRLAIHEILEMTEALHPLVLNRAPAEEIKTKARQLGMMTLRQDGWKKVLKGLTTPEEVLRVAPTDTRFVTVQKIDLVPKAEATPVIQEVPVAAPAVTAAAAAVASPQPAVKNAPPTAAEESAFNDRRKYERIDVQMPVQFKIVNYEGTKSGILKFKKELEQTLYDCESEDISAGGMLLRCPDAPLVKPEVAKTEMKLGDALDVGMIIDLSIQLPDQGKPILCVAKILRMKRSLVMVRDTSRFVFHLSLLFLVIDSMDRLRIEKFCQEFKTKL